MFLIVGLGNPGKPYINNRHNIGYKIIDEIKEIYNFPNFNKKFHSEFSKSEIDENVTFLLKPTTYMNNSGIAVKEFKEFYNINNNKIYVIHDEIDLDQGRVKIKVGGGHNGHNGIKSLDQFIGKDYNRVRIGVSRPSRIYENNVDENISSWVLSNFSSDERIKWVNDTINKVAENIHSLIKDKDIFLKKFRNN